MEQFDGTKLTNKSTYKMRQFNFAVGKYRSLDL